MGRAGGRGRPWVEWVEGADKQMAYGPLLALTGCDNGRAYNVLKLDTNGT